MRHIPVRNYDYPDAGRWINAIVDDESYHGLVTSDWHTITGGYVRTGNLFGSDGPALMHRVVLPGFLELDHRNRNKLDNRRRNLRSVTRSTNTQNTEGRGKIPYRGVYQPSRADYYLVTYSENGVQQFPRNRFATAEEAARYYDYHARRVYGSSAFQNGV